MYPAVGAAVDTADAHTVTNADHDQTVIHALGRAVLGLLEVRGPHSPDCPQRLEWKVRIQRVTAEVQMECFFPSRCSGPFSQVFSIKSPLNYIFIGLFTAELTNSNASWGQIFYSFDSHTLYIKHTGLFFPSTKKMLSAICFIEKLCPLLCLVFKCLTETWTGELYLFPLNSMRKRKGKCNSK